LIINFSDFKELEFPRTSDIVYILYFRRSDDNSEVPFYVGESSRHIGRFGDYVSAKYSAPTDYKVGEAIKYMRDFGLYIGIKYKETNNRKGEEREIINKFRENYLLLNDLPGFDYKNSNEDHEKIKIHEFIQKIFNKIHAQTNDIEDTENTNKNNKSALRKEKYLFDYRDNQEMGRIISGTVTSPGIYKTDHQYRFELVISKGSSDMLPHEYGKKKIIKMTIGNIQYEAGVHETEKRVVWISSVLHTKGKRREKVRLVDALAEIELKKGDKISITINSEGSYTLQAQ
jgi:hypothetical protein